LEKSSEPLSFIVFVPEWRDPVTPALTRMEASRFLRHQLNIPAFEHEYRSGSQHICKRYRRRAPAVPVSVPACELCVLCVLVCTSREEMYYRAVHGTAVLFLQNDAGFAKWAPTAERLAELMVAYRPSTARPSPSPAPITPGDKDSAPKAADRTQGEVLSPGGHDDNNNSNNSNTTNDSGNNNNNNNSSSAGSTSSSSSSSTSPQEKMANV